jgi:ABC-type Fe3+/spermidine/putrescine transport system ATPase subunit
MLEVSDIYKTYEGKPLLKGVSFQIQAGETVCLLGPSGSGKSTLLRIIAGLEPAESGQVSWEGRNLQDVPVHQRGFGLMFQDYALFPHLTAAENVAFGLRMQNMARSEIDQRVTAAMQQVGMAGFARRRVTDLSGGEQQRVALARALAPRPRLLMLDEPLGALDRRLREQLLDDLHHLLHISRIPAVYVTHDQEEAFALADRLVLLHEGVIAQQGSPAEVYASPLSTWVAGFLGLNNLMSGRVKALDPLLMETAHGCFHATPASGFSPRLHQGVTLLFRPEGVRYLDADQPEAQLRGQVEDAPFRGGGFRLEIRIAEGLLFSFPAEKPLRGGEQIGLCLNPQAVVAYPLEDESHG